MTSLYAVPMDRPFSREQARRSGVSDRLLSQLVAHGRLRRPIRGIYVSTDLEDTLVLRCAVLRMIVPEDAFVCDRTAAWVHVGERALGPGEHLSVPMISCYLRSGHTRLRNGLVSSGERRVEAADLMDIQGLRLTTPLRTALDLGRLGGSKLMRLAGMDAMLATGTFTHQEMLEQIGRFRGQRGVVLMRILAPLSDGGAASFGESGLRLAWYEAGLPRPQTQVEVPREGRAPLAIDLGLDELRFGAEYFGEQWHGEAESEHDQSRLTYLREERGWAIEVFRREEVFGRHRNADRTLRHRWQEFRARHPAPRLT